MDKQEHAARLRKAIAARGIGRRDLADAVSKKERTITNWTTGATLPDEIDREKLRRLFPGYDSQGDPVEVAVRGSELHEWRQDAVLSNYKKHLHEQRAEQAG